MIPPIFASSLLLLPTTVANFNAGKGPEWFQWLNTQLGHGRPLFLFLYLALIVFFAFFYNALGIPLAAGVLYPFFGILLSPMIAAAAMSSIPQQLVAMGKTHRAFFIPHCKIMSRGATATDRPGTESSVL